MGGSCTKHMVDDKYIHNSDFRKDHSGVGIDGSTTIIIIIIIIIICHTSNHWSHRNCKQKFTKISGNNTRTTLNRFFTKNCHTRNITHHKVSAII
jgi:hypothetical protein